MFSALDSYQKESFLQLLPADWREELEIFESHHPQAVSYYGITYNGKIVGGGCVFMKSYPQKKGCSRAVDSEMKQGTPYIGFLWMDESVRGKGFGSLFLDSLRTYYPAGDLWLICAEELVSYYKKRGFVVIDSWEDDEEHEKQFFMVEGE